MIFLSYLENAEESESAKHNAKLLWEPTFTSQYNFLKPTIAPPLMPVAAPIYTILTTYQSTCPCVTNLTCCANALP